MSILLKTTFVLVAAVICYSLQIAIQNVYLRNKYGAGYEKFYRDASITKFDLLGTQVKRNNRIRIYLKIKDCWCEGRVVGLTTKNVLVIRNYEGDIIGYKKDFINSNEFLLLS